ncbi:MAG: hypothetical protein D8M59_13285 [Planctomycetes bacterium]|nr:hypothetical protein [Planctomycetota bacterium]NOG54975.1 flagellar filament capping protein FliD [Planctomycetota bacterium]
MTGISTGIGLISGINTASLIDQLMAIEARPKVLAISRQTQLQAEQAAFMGLNSKLLSLKTTAAKFYNNKIFRTNTATSSDSKVLTASAGTTAQPGVYNFVVNRLVSSSQMLSKGFANSDTTELGATSLSFEWGNGKLTRDTELASLNEGEGVRRGSIDITDADGATASVDLSTAFTVGDVLDAINGELTLGVTASVSGDQIVISNVDEIDDSSGYYTATDLGINATAVGNTITGSQINQVYADMALADLNDGNGVYIAGGLGTTSFSVDLSNGESFDVVLGDRDDGGGGTESSVTTIQGVLDRINEHDTAKFEAAIGDDGVSIKITDKTGGGGTFEVTAGTSNNEQTARDLGIFTTGVAGVIDGDRILAGLNSVLTKHLNGGAGLSGNTALDITDRAGNTDSFTIDENSSITDIIAQINASGSISVTASLNQSGNGLLITDTTGSAVSNLIIDGTAASELGISTGASGVAADSYAGSNVQVQYVALSSQLDDLNYGRGVGTGSFRVTDGYGNQMTIDIGSDADTLGDVISEINSLASAQDVYVQARINDNGDGLILETELDGDSSPLVLPMEVESVSGTTAKDLGILGEASATDQADNYIDGAYEKTVTLEATDTLDDVITAINNAGILVNATLINDGGSSNPYHLSITSKLTGSSGDLIVDSGGLDFDLSVLTEAHDAIVFFGSTDPAKGMAIRSTTNTLDDVVAGVTIDLKATDTDAVELTVARDIEGMINSVTEFVSSYNSVLTEIGKLDYYDTENESRGILLGNSTIARIRSQLQRTIQEDAIGVETQYENLLDVGIRFGEGGQLTVDKDDLRDALNEDLEAVENLFAAKVLSDDQGEEIEDGVTIHSDETLYDELGIAEQIKRLADQLTDSVDGTLTIVNQNYDTQISLQEKRIELFDDRLAARRAYLEAQFASMEQALASLQYQQSALSSIQPIKSS